MKLMFTYKDNDFFIRVIIENCNCIRWCDTPLHKITLWSKNFIKIPEGTVMPKDWMR